MNAVYGIGAPANSISNNKGWAAFISDSSYGTTTEGEGLATITGQTLEGAVYNLNQAVQGHSSYNKSAIQNYLKICIEAVGALLVLCIIVIALANTPLILAIDIAAAVMIVSFVKTLMWACAAMLVVLAAIYLLWTSIDWSKWPNL